MSVKVYNVYKFIGNFQELLIHLKVLKSLYYKHILEFYSHESIKALIVKKTLKEQKIKKEYYSIMYLFAQKTLEALNRNQKEIALNKSASCLVYFHNDSFYIQFFNLSCKEVEEYLVEHNKLFIDYHYQDQSDPYYVYLPNYKDLSEEEISNFDEEYKGRVKVWESIGIIDQAPIDCGLTFEFITTNTLETLSSDLFKNFDFTILDKYKNVDIEGF